MRFAHSNNDTKASLNLISTGDPSGYGMMILKTVELMKLQV